MDARSVHCTHGQGVDDTRLHRLWARASGRQEKLATLGCGVSCSAFSFPPRYGGAIYAPLMISWACQAGICEATACPWRNLVRYGSSRRKTTNTPRKSLAPDRHKSDICEGAILLCHATRLHGIALARVGLTNNLAVACSASRIKKKGARNFTSRPEMGHKRIRCGTLRRSAAAESKRKGVKRGQKKTPA